MSKINYMKEAMDILMRNEGISLEGRVGKVVRHIIAKNPSVFVKACIDLEYATPVVRYPNWLRPVITLSNVPGCKIQAIKKLRELCPMALLSAKYIVEMLSGEKEWVREIRFLVRVNRLEQAEKECRDRGMMNHQISDLLCDIKKTLIS